MELTRIRVQWGDTDAAGFVYYPNIVRWMDQACHDLHRAIGFTDEDMRRPDLAQFLAGEIDCRFLAPLVYGEELAVEARVLKLEERRVHLEYDFLRLPGRELVARGHELRFFVRKIAPRTIQSAPIPEPFREKLRALMS